MCVIAYFEKDRELNKEELKNCFIGNPDGAGIMYYDKKKNLVHIQKGFMDFGSFWAVAKKLPRDLDRVFHFRIATSGKVSGACCHPFPVTNNYEQMSRVDTWSKMGMVHNGVMHDFTPDGGMKASHSDTMQFIKEVVYPLRSELRNPAIRYLWEEAMSGNKYIVLDKQGAVLFGNFVQSTVSGAMYSNTSYKSLQERYKNFCTPQSYYYRDYNTSKYDYGEYGNWGEENIVDITIAVNVGPLKDINKLEETLEREIYSLGFDVITMDYDNGTMYVDIYNEYGLTEEGLPETIAGYRWSLC